MGLIISAKDFRGRWAHPKQVGDDLDDFINENERALLIELLGDVLLDDLLSDLDSNGTPQSAKYKYIFDPFHFQYTGAGDGFGCGCYERCYSDGLKAMLKNFIFFDYMRHIKWKHTVTGVVVNSPDTSTPVIYGDLYQYYNYGVSTFKCIQNYLRNNDSTYNYIKIITSQDGLTEKPIYFAGICSKDYSEPYYL